MLKLLHARGAGWAVAAGLAGAAFLLLMARGLLDHAPHYDELLHVLSARGLLAAGEPVIADGHYLRARFFTRTVAWSLDMFGDSLVAARLPALAAGAALVFLLGAWMVRRAGLLAGVAAAVLLCVVPMTVSMAVFARFYTVHALVVAMMLIALFEAVEPGRSRLWRLGLALVAVGLVPLALHLQQTTMVAAGAGLAGVLAVLVHDRWQSIWPVVRRRPVLTGVVLSLAFALVLYALWHAGLIGRLGSVTPWAERNADRYQYYLVGFAKDMPLLWPLLPLAAALALIDKTQRRLAIFALVVAGVALSVQSVAAQKAMRYAFYVAPWICVVWACALAAVTTRPEARETSAAGARRGLGPLVLLVLLGVGFVFSLEGTRALNFAAGRLAAIDNLPYQGESDWTPIVAELEPRVHSADRVVTSNSMKALYYLGHYDYELNVTIVPETVGKTEFGVDLRTGRKAIGAAASITQVLEAPGATLVVLEEAKIGRPSGVRAESFAVIEARCGELELPPGSGARAWWCPGGP